MQRKYHGIMSEDDLVTLGIPATRIPGLQNNENHSQEEIEQVLQKMTKDKYDLEEIFGHYCQLACYIDCPASMVFEYCANIYSLNEWTFSMRNFEHIGGGIYRSEERLGKDTYVYTEVISYPDSGVIDYLCAWDQAEELWMRYFFRILDSLPVIRLPGSVVLWTNCKHPYYDRNTEHLPEYIAKEQARPDRKWVGDFWLQFEAIHKIELQNLKTILEYRFDKGVKKTE